ncbi:MAG: hypothetical protein H7Z74_12825 [Anaerolineae bacterium]|nr:hypothetical protein [Gemmatimonadaceae bacterium]
MTRAVVAICVLLSGCASGGGGDTELGGGGRAGGSFRREDRVFIGESNEITGIAASQRMVFATTRDALLILDKQFGSWSPPVTVLDGYPGGPVSAMAADPIDDGVWIGTLGGIVYYRPQLDVLTTAVVAGIPAAILFDARDPLAGAYVGSAAGWSLVTRTGNVTPVQGAFLPPPSARVQSSNLNDVYREYPALQNFLPTMLRDEQLQSWPVTTGTKAPGSSEVWVGTRGNGVYRVDPLFNRAEHFPFGLLDEGIGALAAAADGIWMAGLGTGSSARSGITFASSDLRRWRWVEGSLSRPFRGARAYDLSVRARAAWVATDRGVVRVETQNENNARVWSLGNGLPDDRALSLATSSDGAWVGTARGLVFITDSLNRRSAPRSAVSATLAAGTAVRALLLTGDTLWIGSDAGLLVMASGDSGPHRPSAAAAESRLRRPITALARSDSEVVVATTDDLVRISAYDGQIIPRYQAVSLAQLRGITAVAMDSSTIWVAGRGGLLVITRDAGVPRFLTAPGDLPGEAYDVLLTRDYAWVATRTGLARITRLRDGTPR